MGYPLKSLTMHPCDRPNEIYELFYKYVYSSVEMNKYKAWPKCKKEEKYSLKSQTD